jgi:flagellar hook protein FlgE
MASFSIPLTGLKADSTALNTIADDLTNMNTTGYKSQTTSFADLFYQQIGTTGSGDEIEQGSGVKVATNSTDFTQGTISSTGVSSDVAINGSGFFVLDDNGSQLLTRNGEFQLNSDGKLETSSGMSVMGYSATDGVVNTGGTLTDITIPTDSTMSPSATTTLSMTQNLDSSDSVGTSTTGTVKVYDSLGNSYEATVTYEKTGTNEWSYSVSLPDTLQGSTSTSSGTTTTTYDFGSSGGTSATVNTGTDLTITGDTTSGGTATITAPTITSGESVSQYASDLNTAISNAGVSGVSASVSASGQLVISGTNFSTSGSVIQDPVASSNATGTLSFDSSGKLTSPGADVSGITFSGLSDGASNLNLTWDLYSSSGTSDISQTSSSSSTSSTSQNGYAAGTYSSYSIGSDGTISVSYSNGETQNVGQLAIATVTNEQGLVSLGSSEYETTNASGTATYGVAGTSGRGSLEGSSLEASNVNISTEFSALIVAQRAFEANAKSVTTFDTVTQDTINMVH